MNPLLTHIENCLAQAAQKALVLLDSPLGLREKEAGDPLTLVDEGVNELLLNSLPRAGEGWLSEESLDQTSRLSNERLWIVDPIDGTKELVAGIPEWSISVGYCENNEMIAGGICNPLSQETVIGGCKEGIWLNGKKLQLPTQCPELQESLILASRSESARGEWDRFASSDFQVKAVGSVAYKLALVACQKAQATWSLKPKNEWDIAAGAALLREMNYHFLDLNGKTMKFNQPEPLRSGFLALPKAPENSCWQALLLKLLAST